MRELTEGLRRHAERQRLARVLGCSPGELDFLAPVPSEDLRALRQAFRDDLERAQRPLMLRAVQASRLLPASLLATIGVDTLGPRLCARLCEHMGARQLAGLCRRLPPAFLAEVALDLDIEKLLEVAESLPPELIHDIAGEMLAHGNYLLFGEILDRLPFRLLPLVAGAIHDGEALLRGALLVEQPTRLQEVLELLPVATLRDSLRAAARSPDELLVPALALLASARPAWQRRLMLQLLQSREAVLNKLLRAIAQQDRWRAVLPLLGRLSPDELRPLMIVSAWRDTGLLEGLLHYRRQPTLLPLVKRLQEAMPPALATRAQAVPEMQGAGWGYR